MADEIVVGSTRRNLRVALVDENDDPISLVGAHEVQLQADEDDADVDVAMNVVGTGNTGEVEYVSIGSVIDYGDLGGADSKSIRFRVYFEDAAGLKDYSEQFELQFVSPPIAPAGP